MDAFQQRASEAGYRVSPSAKSHYARGLLRRIEGNIDVLALPPIVRLLSHAQLRKGRAYTFAQMKQIAQPDAAIERFQNAMQHLVAQQLFRPGYNLTCAYCALTSWQNVGQLRIPLICVGCGSALSLPLNAELAYQPNPLLCEALKSGLLSVLLLQRHWQQASAQSPLRFWHCYMLTGHGIETDLDLVAVDATNRWLIAECKDNFRSTASALTDLQAQLTTLMPSATAFKADFYFATLQSSPLPETLAAYLNSNSITKLTSNALLDS